MRIYEIQKKMDFMGKAAKKNSEMLIDSPRQIKVLSAKDRKSNYGSYTGLAKNTGDDETLPGSPGMDTGATNCTAFRQWACSEGKKLSAHCPKTRTVRSSV